MTTQIETKTIPVKDIIVKNRQRKDFNNVESLAESIQKIGLLQPICVNDQMELLAGERRLRAHKHLSLESIEARVFPNVSESDTLLIEYLENFQREDFTWQEDIQLKYKMHFLWSKEDSTWSYRKSSKKLGVSLGGLSTDLDLAQAAQSFPQLLEAKTKGKAKESWKKLVSQAQAKQTMQSFSPEEQQKLEKMMTGEGSKAEEKKVVGKEKKPPKIVRDDTESPDFSDTPTDSTDTEKEAEKSTSTPSEDQPKFTYRITEWATLLKEMPNNCVGFAELDPPYAIDYNETYTQANKEATETDWSVDEYRSQMNKLIPKLYNKMMDNTWVLCWTGHEHALWMNDLAKKSGFQVQKPGVWVKPGGSSNHPSTTMISNYETFLLFRKGQPTFNVASVKGAQTFDTVPFAKRYHQWEKPLDMYLYFIDALAHKDSLMLVPFAGSGNSMLAGILSGLTPIGCDTKNQYFYAFIKKLKEHYPKMEI